MLASTSSRMAPLLVVLWAVHFSEGLNCSQCNMRQRGIANTCNDPRILTNCIGCMKTVTKVILRDSGYMTGWERISNVTSRYCMRSGSSKILPEGCYRQQNNGGYTERCFCYSDYCNSGAHSATYIRVPSIWSLSPIVVSIWSHSHVVMSIESLSNLPFVVVSLLAPRVLSGISIGRSF